MAKKKQRKRRKKRRTRTDHRGVKIVEISRKSGTTVHVARWKDPDTGKVREQSLDALGIPSEGRRDWAIMKSEGLFGRKQALAAGAPRHTGLSLAETIDEYFCTKGRRLEKTTRDNYRAATDVFLVWAKGTGLKKADDLHSYHLAAFVDWLAVQRAKAPVKGGRRKDRRPTDRSLGPGGVNARIRALKAVLNHLRRLGKLAHIASDHIKDTLKLLPVPKRKPKYLRPSALKKLLEAAIRHDKETYAMTRKEKAAKRKGETRKHIPIAAFVVYGLLGGCRLEESLEIPCEMVDLEARDDFGRISGEITLDAERVKTRYERTVDLVVSAALRTRELEDFRHCRRSSLDSNWEGS